MNSKIMIAATVAALSLATTAFAGEGDRNSLDQFTVQQANSSGVGGATGAAQYPAPNPALSFAPLGMPVFQENGQNRPVQTANSLPVGFENGTVAYTQAQSINRWYAQQAEHRFAQAQLAGRTGD